MQRVVALLKGKYAVLNLIPYNSLAEDEYSRPDTEHTAALVSYLRHAGILTKIRNSAGQDIDGGCGQLRARAERPAKKHSAAIITRQ